MRKKPTQAEIEKNRLEAEAQKAITNLYVDFSTYFTVEATKYVGFNTNMSPTAKQAVLNNLKTGIKVQLDNIESKETEIIINSSKRMGDKTILDMKNLMYKTGLDMSGAFPNVVDNVVDNVVSGKPYKRTWNLYREIQKDVSNINRDINRITQWGLDEGKTVYEIVQDMSKYADPRDKSKFKVTGKHKVAAYAQRIARTMIQHVYQLVLRRTCKNNPYIQAFKWTSAGAPTTCEVCQERDGMLFPIGVEPLDHPNGWCWLELVTMPLEEFKKKVAWWSEGQYNEIEYYITDAFGYSNKDAIRKDIVSKYMKQQY